LNNKGEKTGKMAARREGHPFLVISNAIKNTNNIIEAKNTSEII